MNDKDSACSGINIELEDYLDDFSNSFLIKSPLYRQNHQLKVCLPKLRKFFTAVF